MKTLILKTLFISICLIGGIHCISEEPIPITLEDPDTAEYAPSDAGDFEDADAEVEWEKEPHRSPRIYRDPYDLWDGTEAGSNPGNRTLSHHGIREHMHTTVWARRTWLNEGEYFVLDASFLDHYDYFDYPATFYTVVLHQGQPLPFSYEEVTERFPSMEEIESWGPDDYYYSTTFTREQHRAFNYTFVIPPWAFPEPGAYNVEIIVFPVWETCCPGFRYLAARAGPVGDNLALWENRTFTIFYGGDDFPRISPRFPNRQSEATTWETTDPGLMVLTANSMLLTAPQDLCDWTQFEEPHRLPCITDELVSPEKTITLDLHTAAGDSWLRDADTQQKNLYLVFRDDEVIDGFLFDPGKEIPFDDLMALEAKGHHLPIEIELTDELAQYFVLLVPDPYSPQPDDDSITLNSPLPSNALLMRHGNPPHR